jgi:hypothetical protein
VQRDSYASRLVDGSRVYARDEQVLLSASQIDADADLLRRGIANNGTFTPRAIVWILVGHVVHHVAVLRERYHVA